MHEEEKKKEEGKKGREKKIFFSPGIEPRTFCMVGPT